MVQLVFCRMKKRRLPYILLLRFLTRFTLLKVKVVGALCSLKGIELQRLFRAEKTEKR